MEVAVAYFCWTIFPFTLSTDKLWQRRPWRSDGDFLGILWESYWLQGQCHLPQWVLILLILHWLHVLQQSCFYNCVLLYCVLSIVYSGWKLHAGIFHYIWCLGGVGQHWITRTLRALHLQGSEIEKSEYTSITYRNSHEFVKIVNWVSLNYDMKYHDNVDPYSGNSDSWIIFCWPPCLERTVFRSTFNVQNDLICKLCSCPRSTRFVSFYVTFTRSWRLRTNWSSSTCGMSSSFSMTSWPLWAQRSRSALKTRLVIRWGTSPVSGSVLDIAKSLQTQSYSKPAYAMCI